MFNRLQAFMLGRNGPDRLALAAFVAAIVVNVLSRIFLGNIILMLLSMLLLVYAIFRIFSKNLAKRREENYRFTNIWGDTKAAFSRWKERRAQSKEYKFFTCPGCKNKLRVPKGKGKLQITCPRCGLRFGGKT